MEPSAASEVLIASETAVDVPKGSASPAKAEVNTPPAVEETPSDSSLKENVPSSAPLSPSKGVKEDHPKSPTKPVPPMSNSEEKAPTEDQGENGSAETKEAPKLFEVEEHHETKEVIDRLLDVKSLEESVSGLWGWMSGGVSKVAEQTKKVAEQATKVAEKASQQAAVVAEQASQQASIVAEKASQQATIVAESAVKARAIAEQQAKELAASMTKTMEDKGTSDSKTTSTSVPNYLPWETAHPERRAEARERVLKLSMDDHTFTVPPPKDANYVYDPVAREGFAARMLDTDALLSAKRFKLVPKVVDEQEFWRNYFYRVELVLNALGVPASAASPAAEKDSPAKEAAKTAAASAADASKHRDLEEEMRKEIARAEASHMEDAVKEDENFDMLEDDLEFDDDGELEKSINDLNL